MLEALLCGLIAFLVTSGLIPLLFNVGKETVTSSAKSNTTKKVEKKPKYDAEQDYQYTFRGHGVVITGCNLWNRTELRIPPMIQYMPVRDIESGAFKECKNLKKVLLPEHVAYIASDVFVNTENLTLYGRYESYGHKYAQQQHIRFRDADYFDVDEQKVYTKDSDFTDTTVRTPKKEEKSKPAKTELPQTLRFDYYDVVKENGGLTIKKFVGVDKPILTVPAELGGIRVLEIDTGAFSDCKYIEKVTISEGILAIRNGAFADCPNLRSVVLPSTLKSFGNDSELKQSTSQQAVFHNCRLQSINMPPAIINIGERAFYDCDLLKDIMLPDGLEVIGAEAFWGCTSLSKVRIPKSVQTIGKDVFKTKGEGNRKRNLNITLYCYGGSAGLEYARANNLAYKDAEELE
ncbi:MAG: leucine-rich repeat protein [Peptococcaceae bacterium]|nr:leucine-rich repeat protein [Peptococcaceae bacterium]